MSNTRKTTATTKRSGTRKPAATRRNSKLPEEAVEQLDGFTPVRITTTEKDEEQEEERIDLFFIDDKGYSVLKNIGPNVGLRYLRQVRDFGANLATINLFEAVVGDDAYDALESCKDVTRKQIDEIIGFVVLLATGAVDPGKL